MPNMNKNATLESENTSSAIRSPNSSAVVVPLAEIQRLKDQASRSLRETQLNERAKHIAELEKRKAECHSRREQMMAADERRLAEASRLATELDSAEGIQAENPILSKAQSQLDENLEDVREMNQMVNYAKCATIRDLQVKQKAEIKAEKRQLGLVLDDIQLACVDARKQIDDARREARKNATRQQIRLLQSQLEEHAERKLRDCERKRLERERVLREMKAIELDIEMQRRRKAEAQEQLMRQVKEVNDRTHELKLQKEAANKEEDARIAAYLAKKADDERKKEEALKAEKANREAQVAKLRASQRRVMDHQAELDALRAKRAANSADRAARERDAKEREKIDRINKILGEARVAQLALKEELIRDSVDTEKTDFERMVVAQAEAAAKERAKLESQRSLRAAYARDLRKQIAEREAQALKNRKAELDAGTQIAQEEERMHSKLAGIKAKKIAEMTSAGVPDKYTVALKTMKLSA